MTHRGRTRLWGVVLSAALLLLLAISPPVHAVGGGAGSRTGGAQSTADKLEFNIDDAFNWCELSSERLKAVGYQSGLGQLGLKLARWAAANMIPIILYISLFSIGILAVQMMFNSARREVLIQRLPRYLTVYVLIALIASGGIFYFVNAFSDAMFDVPVLMGAEFQQLLKQHNNDFEKAVAAWNAKHPDKRIECYFD